MQNDRNLVQHPINTPNRRQYAYWASNTADGGPNVSLNLDTDGHLYLLNSKGSNIKDLAFGISSVEIKIYLMRIDSDGIFRLYSQGLGPNGNWSISWSSSSDKCDPKRLCGLNAYWVNNDDQVDCRCLPGFDFVSPGNQSSGCERNFAITNCKSNDWNPKYTTQALVNTIWEDSSYSNLQ